MPYQNQVLEGVQSRIKARLDNSLQQETEYKREQAKGLHDIIWSTNPAVTDEMRDRATADLQKLYPQQKDLLGRIREVSGKVFGFLKAPPEVQNREKQKSEQTLQQVTGGTATPEISSQPVAQTEAQIVDPEIAQTYSGLIAPPPSMQTGQRQPSSSTTGESVGPTGTTPMPLPPPPTMGGNAAAAAQAAAGYTKQETIEAENRKAAIERENKRRELAQMNENTMQQAGQKHGFTLSEDEAKSAFWDAEPTIGIMYNRHTGDSKPIPDAILTRLTKMQKTPGKLDGGNPDGDFAWGDPTSARFFMMTGSGLEDVTTRFHPFPPGSGSAIGYATINTVDAAGNPITIRDTNQNLAGRGPFNAPPTADMRNKEAAKQMVRPSVDMVHQVGNKLISGKSTIEQAAKGAGMSVESYLADNPDYKTYQAARFALAAQLAVATQGSRPSDVDVMKIWVPMIPNVFFDTEDSAKQKWEVINAMAGLGAGQTYLPPPPTIDIRNTPNVIRPGQTPAPAQGAQSREQSRKVGDKVEYRYTTDGGKTWKPGRLPAK